jgi:transketolase
MSSSPIAPEQLDKAPSGLDRRSRELRKTIIKMLAASGRAHFGSAFSILEIVRVLYDHILRYDPTNPKWPGRDRCILSKGHGCLALYVVLADKGLFPESELWKFCKPDGILGGHPEHKIPGVEASTGSLGHGLSIGIGFALNARYEKADYRTFVIIGDGESNEGSIWEAALCAGKHRLSNLTVIVDYNKQQSYGTTFEVQNLEPLADKWRAFGFAVTEVDGHDVEVLRSTLSGLPLDSQRPTAVICHTIKGKGIKFVENNLKWHHKSKVTDEEVQSLLAALEAAP